MYRPGANGLAGQFLPWQGRTEWRHEERKTALVHKKRCPPIIQQLQNYGHADLHTRNYT